MVQQYSWLKLGLRVLCLFDVYLFLGVHLYIIAYRSDIVWSRAYNWWGGLVFPFICLLAFGLLLRSPEFKAWMKVHLQIANCLVLVEIMILTFILQLQPLVFPALSEDWGVGMWYVTVTTIMCASYLNLLDLPPLQDSLRDKPHLSRFLILFWALVILGIVLLKNMLHPSVYWIFTFLLHAAYVVYPEAGSPIPVPNSHKDSPDLASSISASDPSRSLS